MDQQGYILICVSSLIGYNLITRKQAQHSPSGRALGVIQEKYSLRKHGSCKVEGAILQVVGH